MFHTFQTALGSAGEEQGEGPSKPPQQKRISTTNACVECRRRKIRCDGSSPCGQCQWYQHPERCSYQRPQQRVVPSRKLVERLNASVEQHQVVIQRLFPSRDINSLVNLSRDDLIEAAMTSQPQPSTSPTSTSTRPSPWPFTRTISDSTDGLEALEQAPTQNSDWDEASRNHDRIQSITDDINGLSMSLDRQSSYVGVSSVTAALKVIMKAAPLVQFIMSSSAGGTTPPSRANSTSDQFYNDDLYALPPLADGQALIDHYFNNVAPFFPMVDEQRFRETYLYGERKDTSWLVLLNMVFALGLLSSSTSDNTSHTIFFRRARQHTDLNTLGSSSLEMLQALGMMSGYYLHYLNRPNEGNSLMGASLRMACTLGLHREYADVTASSYGQTTAARPRDSVPAEIRRRTWWSLFCLDTWASTTTGRPSLGSIGPAISVEKPGKAIQQNGDLAQLEVLKILPLIHNLEFCKIATLIQDRLATSPFIQFDELGRLDAQIGAWRDELPSILMDDEPCPDFLRVPRAVMKWRYQNLRILLHRPYLLSSSLRRIAFAALSPEEKFAVGKCRRIAAKTVEDISNECPYSLIAGWNAVWFMYQAALVPLVSLFSDRSNEEETTKWRQQVEVSVNFFDRMTKYSVAARKSKEVMAKLVEASKAVSSPQTSSSLAGSTEQVVWTDSLKPDGFWDEMMWHSHPNRDMDLWDLRNDDWAFTGGETATGADPAAGTDPEFYTS